MSGLVAIIDYGAGNLRSAHKAFEKAATGLSNPPRVIVTADTEQVMAADRIVLPGVGAFADCRKGLLDVHGMSEVLVEKVIDGATPFLGICVGMQLMATRGLEKGEHAGFGWIDGTVELLTPADPALKVPHMGWNTLDVTAEHPLFAGIPTGPDGWHAYFVHSFHLNAERADDVLATTRYGMTVTAAVARDNLAGTQFHPEKSQKLGLKLIENFLTWAP